MASNKADFTIHLSEARALRLAINGKPAMRAITEFEYRPFRASPVGSAFNDAEGAYVMTASGWSIVDNTIEEVAALWDAAAPAVAPTVDRWQACTTGGGKNPTEYPDQLAFAVQDGFKPAGIWEVAGFSVDSGWAGTLWKRPLTRVVPA